MAIPGKTALWLDLLRPACIFAIMSQSTPFHEFHLSLNAQMTDVAGWHMPLAYARGPLAEHVQCRNSGALFDLSHMGRIYLSGRDVPVFLDRVVTCNVAGQEVGTSRQGLLCNPAGGILDEVTLCRDTRNWILLCNAANREKVVAYLTATRRALDLDLDIADQTLSTAMIAMQGPKVIARLAAKLPEQVQALTPCRFVTISIMFIKLTVLRTSVTGEDGYLVILPAKMAGMAVKLLGGRSGESDATIQPGGLAALDTLRLEAGIAKYGQELTESTDPISAGLGGEVDFSKAFVGAEALRQIQQQGTRQTLVGLQLSGTEAAAAGATVLANGTPVGRITSGALAPTIQKSIAMAYVDSPLAGVGTQLMVEATPATVVPLPFYSR